MDFDEIRNLVHEGEENFPVRVNYTVIARGQLPSWAVVAGDFGHQKRDIEFPCFQLVYRDGMIILEAPFSRELFERFAYGIEYFDEEYQKMQNALNESNLIIPTHEHWDHLGGISQSDKCTELMKKSVLTREMIESSTIKDAEFPVGVLKSYQALEYETYYRAAPGVILIKAPGHSMGRQFVFVTLQGGEEILFTGDVVWTNENYKQKKNRPWLASRKRLENRKQIAHQMRYLHEHFYANPDKGIEMVATHDPLQHRELEMEGILNKGIVVAGPENHEE